MTYYTIPSPDYRDILNPAFPLPRYALKRVDATRLAERFLASPPCRNAENYEDYIDACRRLLAASLPECLTRLLDEVRRHQKPAVVIDGLPVESALPGTPASLSGAETIPGIPLSRAIITGLAGFVGEPYTLVSEGAGTDVISHLIPFPSHEGTVTGLGSQKELSLHTENAALVFSGRAPGHLALLGLRRDPIGHPQTCLVDGLAVEATLDNATRAVLRTNEMRIRVPYRHGDGFTDPVSLISGHTDSPTIAAAFYRGMMEPVTTRMERASAAFRLALETAQSAFDIGPGRAVVWSNHRALHARQGFRAVYGSHARWLLRAFSIRNLTALHGWDCVNPRVFDA